GAGLQARQHLEDDAADLAGGPERVRRVHEEEDVVPERAHPVEVEEFDLLLDQRDLAFAGEAAEVARRVGLDADDLGGVPRVSGGAEAEGRRDAAAYLEDLAWLAGPYERVEEVRLDGTVAGLAVGRAG